jgi:putative transcriptional regulator
VNSQGNVYYKGKTTEAGESLLLDYASGSLDEALSLVIASHLSMSSSSRDFVQDCEIVGGHLLAHECEPVSVKPSCLEQTLAKLGTGQAHTIPSRSQIHKEIDGIFLPFVLSGVVSHLTDRQTKWHQFVKGMEFIDVMKCGSSLARLLRMAPATEAPSHSHAGLEVTLILDGAFSDETGEYYVGDLIVEDETTTHSPTACPRQGCVCLAVTTAPIQLTGWMGRFVNPFLR